MFAWRWVDKNGGDRNQADRRRTESQGDSGLAVIKRRGKQDEGPGLVGRCKDRELGQASEWSWRSSDDYSGGREGRRKKRRKKRRKDGVDTQDLSSSYLTSCLGCAGDDLSEHGLS